MDTKAYAKAADLLPLDGIDLVGFWVGNVRQAAAYYRALWGFTPVAFSGLETKVRDRASYVGAQSEIIERHGSCRFGSATSRRSSRPSNANR